MHDLTKRFEDGNKNTTSKNTNIINATNSNQDFKTIDQVSKPLDKITHAVPKHSNNKLNHNFKVINRSDNFDGTYANNETSKKHFDAKEVSKIKDVMSDTNLNLETKSKRENISVASEMKKSVRKKIDDESIKINTAVDVLGKDDTAKISKISTTKINNPTMTVSSSNKKSVFKSSASNIETEWNSNIKVVESNIKYSKNDTDSVSVNDEKSIHSCDKCDYKTNKLGVLNAHRRMFHVNVSNHTKATTINKNVNSSQENNIVTSKFKCDQCDYEAESKTGLEAHRVFDH